MKESTAPNCNSIINQKALHQEELALLFGADALLIKIIECELIELIDKG